MKISVIGIGKVGSTVAFALAKDGLATDLVLYNRTRDVALADAIDIQQAVAFVPYRVQVRDGSLEDTAGSDILVICAGATLPPTEHDRSVLGPANAEVMRELIPPLAKLSPNAIIINVTNPLDAITYHIMKLSGFPWQRVIGTGTLIDSARFREMLADDVGVHPVDLNAYILGEHGDSQFAALSIARCGGEKIETNARRLKMLEEAKTSAWTVFRTKGYTNYAVAMAVHMITQAIVHDLRYTMPVSVLIENFAGVNDVYLSIPCVIGRQGVQLRLKPDLSEDEQSQFQKCAAIVQKMIDETVKIVSK